MVVPSRDPGWLFVLPALLGVLGGALSSAVLRLWQYRRDHWSETIVWFCERLETQADMAADYWCTRGSTKKKSQERTSEARILGMQARLDGLIEIILEGMRDDHHQPIREALSKFRDSVSGGTFQSATGVSDPDRARQVQDDAAELEVLILRYAAEARPERQLFWRIKRRLPFQKRVNPEHHL